MKRTKLILFCTLISFSNILFSQTEVKGNLILKDSSFVNGNLLILSPKDSSLITGQYLSKTKFRIDSKLDTFILQIRTLEYEDQFYQITKSIDLGNISLVEKNLDAVTVSAEILPFQNSNGNPKMNLKNNIFSTSASFRELISKMPGVVFQGEEIVVVGRGSAKIFIDGLETTLLAANSLSPSQIESIEIIKNPDASLDAEGMVAIMIKLKKQGQNGVMGTVLANYTKAFYHLGYADFNAQFKFGKWSFNLGVNTNFGQTGVTRDSKNSLYRDSVPFQVNSSYRERTALDGVSNWLGGIQYSLNDNHSIGLQYNGNYSIYKLDVYTDLENIYPDSISTIAANADAKTVESSHRASLNYNGTLDSLGSKLFLGLNYSHIPENYSDKVYEYTYIPGQTFYQNTVSNGDNKVNLYTAQMDYTKIFLKNHSIKVGAKYNYSDLNSDIFVESESLIEQRNTYYEHIGGVYFQGGFKFKKWELNLGIRSEYTRSKADEILEGDTFIDTSYFSFFPYFDFKIPVKNWLFTTKFTSNIERPSFSEMTPYIYYVNSMFGVEGNPYIRPGFIYGIEQQFSSQKTGTAINVGYRYNMNPATTVPLAQEDGLTETVYRYINLDRKQDLFLEVSQSISAKNFFGYVSSMLSYERYHDQEIELGHQYNVPKLYLYGYFKYSIPNWLNIELFGSLTTAYSDGVVKYKTQGDIGIGISRSFFKDKFMVQLSGNDLFQTAKIRANIAINGEEYDAVITQDTRYFRVTLSYRFGKLKDSKYQHRSIDEDQKNRAN